MAAIDPNRWTVKTQQAFQAAVDDARDRANPEVAPEIHLEVTDPARQLLGNLGHDPAFGARPLKRVIQSQIGDQLAVAMLEGRYSDGGTVKVDAEGGTLVLR